MLSTPPVAAVSPGTSQSEVAIPLDNIEVESPSEGARPRDESQITASRMTPKERTVTIQYRSKGICTSL